MLNERTHEGMNMGVNFSAQILSIEPGYKSVKWQHINLTNWQVVKKQIIKKLNSIYEGRWKEMLMFTWENDSETTLSFFPYHCFFSYQTHTSTIKTQSSSSQALTQAHASLSDRVISVFMSWLFFLFQLVYEIPGNHKAAKTKTNK